MRWQRVVRATFAARSSRPACAGLLRPRERRRSAQTRAGADADPLRPGHVGDLQVRCQGDRRAGSCSSAASASTKGMRVSFRWSRGALATKLDRTRVGYVARVPAGTRAGHRERDDLRPCGPALERDQDHRHRARRGSAARHPRPARCPRSSAATACGSGSSRAPTAATSPRSSTRARAAGISTVFVKSSDGAASRWAQFSPELVAGLKAQGLRVCAWQFVYGNDPLGEASLGVDAIADGADCLVDRRRERLREQVRRRPAVHGRAARDGRPRVPDRLHDRSRTSTTTRGSRTPSSSAPARANANLPQVYWKDIGGTVDAVSGRTLAQNRIYGVADRADRPDLRQRPARGHRAASARCGRRTAAPACRGGPGRRPPSPAGRRSRSRSARLALPPADPGWPALTKRQQGRPGGLAPAAPRVGVPDRDRARARSTTPPTRPCAQFQAARGLPVTGTTDALTWQAVLSLAVAPVSW